MNGRIGGGGGRLKVPGTIMNPLALALPMHTNVAVPS